MAEGAIIEVRAPMVGRVVEILVQVGARVAAEDELLIMESMKMQIPVLAPSGGSVHAIRVATGDSVQEDQILILLGYT